MPYHFNHFFGKFTKGLITSHYSYRNKLMMNTEREKSGWDDDDEEGRGDKNCDDSSSDDEFVEEAASMSY